MKKKRANLEGKQTIVYFYFIVVTWIGNIDLVKLFVNAYGTIYFYLILNELKIVDLECSFVKK